MNERINELREQAADFAEVAYANQTMATFDTNKSIEALFEEKFAELIVKECLVVATRTNGYYTEQFRCAKDDSGRDRAYGAGAACMLVSTEMKQHFGVE